MKKEFDKIKSHINKAIDFHDKNMPKVDSIYICLAAISVDFVLKRNENYVNACKTM